MARANLPIRISLQQPGPGHYILFDAATKKTYPLQWEDAETAWFIFSDSLPKGSQRKLKIKKSSDPPITAVTLTRNEQGVMARNKGRNVFFYQSATAMPPADSPAYYQGSGYIHPLYSPAGKIMTEDFPGTHAHHHAIFHAWSNTRFRNRHVDFWNQQKKEGTVKHNGAVAMKEGPVFAELVTGQDYISLADGAVLREKWTIRCYALNGPFMFDVKVEQINITDDSLYLDKYLYGGMAFRGTRHWDPHNTKAFQNNWNVLTSEGFRDSAANHTPARWVTGFGNIDGSAAAVTIFSHPSNFRYPQKIRVHPDMPYWVYSPVTDLPFVIPPAGSYKARYRYYVSDSKPDEIRLREIDHYWLIN
jgi:hypothetical protein